jgi:hypothetical protein
MPNPLGPFSPFLGSLNQDINPWTWLIRTLNQPFGLINVTNYQTSDPATEQRIVGEVAGYGRQLGRLMDAVTVLLDRLDTAALPAADREAVADFRQLKAQIDAVKRDARRGRLAPAGLRQLVSDLEALKSEDPEAYREVAETLKAAL